MFRTAATRAQLARPLVSGVQRRCLTQNSAEARRYSFAHAFDDVAAGGTPQEALARFKCHAEEVLGRLKHGWFRDGVTHPNSGLPPDGLPRMSWQDKVVSKFNMSDASTYTPTQMVGASLTGFAGFVTVVATMISSSGAASKSKALHERDTEMTVKETA